MIKAVVRRFVLILLISVALAAIAGYLYSAAVYKQFTTNEETVSFVIQPGENIKKISLSLYEKGIVKQPPWLIAFYARITGQATKIKAGEFNIDPAMTLPDLIALFVDGKVVMHAFTIVEGITTQELLEAIKQNQNIKQTLADHEAKTLITTLNISEPSTEGIFLPETYHFPAGMTDIDFLRRAYALQQQTLNDAWQQRAENLPYQTPYETLIMASIIEKETAAADERQLIAGVFVRRLQKQMRLQTDPTVIYGLGEQFDGNLRKKDLKTDTPYNTYTRFGLPPGPICLPSRESIEAALHPADGNSLYFVATGKDGRHVFSSNLNDHNKAVRRYQLKQ